MKKLLTITALLSVSLLFGGCPSNNKNDPKPASGNNYMAGDVNGKSWKADKIEDYWTAKEFVSIAGFNTPENSIVILFFERELAVAGKTVTNESKKGELDKASSTLRKLKPNGSIDGDDKLSRSVTFTFTKASKTEVEGTFSAFRFRDSITNRKFKMKWTNILS